MPEFSDTAFKLRRSDLRAGEDQFGWHVDQGRRTARQAGATFDEVKPQIEQYV